MDKKVEKEMNNEDGDFHRLKRSLGRIHLQGLELTDRDDAHRELGQRVVNIQGKNYIELSCNL